MASPPVEPRRTSESSPELPAPVRLAVQLPRPLHRQYQEASRLLHLGLSAMLIALLEREFLLIQSEIRRRRPEAQAAFRATHGRDPTRSELNALVVTMVWEHEFPGLTKQPYSNPQRLETAAALRMYCPGCRCKQPVRNTAYRPNRTSPTTLILYGQCMVCGRGTTLFVSARARPRDVAKLPDGATWRPFP